MSQVPVNFRLDSGIKHDMEAVCRELGMSMTTAFTIFARKMVREQRIPFDVSLDRPNAETLAAMQEAEDIAAHPENYPSYSSVAEMFADILSEEDVDDAEDTINRRIPA